MAVTRGMRGRPDSQKSQGDGFLPPEGCAGCQPSEVSLSKPGPESDLPDLQGDNCVFEATRLVVIVLTEIET